jgi:hypothetical protein
MYELCARHIAPGAFDLCSRNVDSHGPMSSGYDAGCRDAIAATDV